MAKFVKGKSGNPGGRPKTNEDFKNSCIEYSQEALDKLVSWMRTGGEAVSIKASQIIIEHAHGKPHQTLGGDTETGEIPVSMTVKYVKPNG